MERSVAGEELVLLAKVRPVAQARVALRLTDLSREGCPLAMSEVAVSRPLRWVPESVQRLGVAPRNRECTWRLAKIAEQQLFAPFPRLRGPAQLLRKLGTAEALRLARLLREGRAGAASKSSRPPRELGMTTSTRYGCEVWPHRCGVTGVCEL